jgi:hypothetical protein
MIKANAHPVNQVRFFGESIVIAVDSISTLS